VSGLFEISAPTVRGRRLGRLTTAHGEVAKTAIMTSRETLGAVKGVAPTSSVRSAATRLLGNADHIGAAPGVDQIPPRGGSRAEACMRSWGWDGPDLGTDSGGSR